MDDSAAVSNDWAEALHAEQVLPRLGDFGAELEGSGHRLGLEPLTYKLLRTVTRFAFG